MHECETHLRRRPLLTCRAAARAALHWSAASLELPLLTLLVSLCSSCGSALGVCSWLTLDGPPTGCLRSVRRSDAAARLNSRPSSSTIALAAHAVSDDFTLMAEVQVAACFVLKIDNYESSAQAGQSASISYRNAHCEASSLSGSQAGASPGVRLVPGFSSSAAESPHSSAAWLLPVSTEWR